mgnify:CR=1 FL=1
MQILHVNKKYPLNIRYNGRTVRAVNYRGLGKVWRLPARTSENYEFQRLLLSGTSYDEMEGVYKKNGKEVNEKDKGVIYGGAPFKLWRPQGLNEQQLLDKYGSIAFLQTNIIVDMFNIKIGTSYQNRADDYDIGIVVKVPKSNHLYAIIGPAVNFSTNGMTTNVGSQFFRKSGPKGHIFYAARLQDVQNKEFNFGIRDTTSGEFIEVRVKRFSTPYELDGSKGITIYDLDFFIYNHDGSKQVVSLDTAPNGEADEYDRKTGNFNYAFIGGGKITKRNYRSGYGNSD